MNRLLPFRKDARAVRRLVLTLLCSAMLHSTIARSSDDLASDAIDLARLIPGAQIECTTPDGRIEVLRPNESSQASAAMLRDESLSCPLQQGVTTFVIKLASATLLDRFTFINENASAAGELNIAVSNYQLPATSAKWVPVDGSVVFSHKRFFKLSMLGVEARYVKLSFKVENGGRISGLGLYGGQTLDRHVRGADINQQFALISGKESRKRERTADFDYATLRAKGRVVYISSGEQQTAVKMIDDNNETGHRFTAADRRPTAIVELAATEDIHRVTALYRSHKPGRFDVYLLEDISKSATDLNYRKPIASAETTEEENTAAVEFDPEGTRYVAVSFTPNDGAGDGRAFEIVEINAYGDMPMAMLDALEAPGVYTEISAATFPGEGGPDISSKLGVIAIPPTLPVISE
jgi:hypothetical protein